MEYTSTLIYRYSASYFLALEPLKSKNYYLKALLRTCGACPYTIHIRVFNYYDVIPIRAEPSKNNTKIERVLKSTIYQIPACYSLELKHKGKSTFSHAYEFSLFWLAHVR